MTTFAGLYGPETIFDRAGRPLRLANVVVLAADGVTPAVLYTSRTKAVTTPSNTVQTTSDGNLSFFADPGAYRLRWTVAGVTHILDVEVPQDFEDQGGAVLSVNGRTGVVTLAAADVGAVPQSAVGVSVAQLVGGKVPSGQIPGLSWVRSHAVANQAAMLALTGVVAGEDLALRQDGAGTFLLTGADPSQLGSWTLLPSPTDAVVSVNGRTGAVVLAAADVGADAAGAATAVQGNLTTHTSNTSNPHATTAAQAGAPNVVVHGATAGTARPAGATLVLWIGSVAPSNAATNDWWWDTSVELSKRWSGSAWKASGAGTYEPVLVGDSTPRALRAIKAAADTGRSFGVGVASDSTANAGSVTKHWPYLLAADFATRYPNFTVDYYLWNDANQNYDALAAAGSDTSVRIQAGPSGDPFINISASSYNIANADIVRASADLDIRALVTLAAWPPPAAGTSLVAHYGAAGQRELKMYLDTTSKLALIGSVDGTATFFAGSSVLSGLVVGQTLWFRVTRVSSTGVCSFYTSPDGVTWTAQGTSTQATGALFGSTAVWEFGAEQGTSTSLATGTKFYDVDIRDGIAGNRVSPWLISTWLPFNAAGEANGIGGSPRVIFLSGSRAGADLAYLSLAGRLAQLYPNAGQRVIILAASHNDVTSVGSGYQTSLDSWLTAVRGQRPGCELVVCTQNPEVYTSGISVRPAHHARRRFEQMAWAKKNGLPIIDAAQAFYNDPNYTNLDAAHLIKADGTHPTNPGDIGVVTSGSTLWANQVIAAVAYNGS